MELFRRRSQFSTISTVRSVRAPKRAVEADTKDKVVVVFCVGKEE